MRKISIRFLYFYAVFFTFCTFKNDNESANSRSIIGTWHWQKSMGGSKGNEIITPQATGVNKKLVFGFNKKVTVFTNGNETGRYNYTIKKGNSRVDKKQHYLLTFNDMNYVIQHLDENNLSIQDNFTDGYTLTYVK